MVHAAQSRLLFCCCQQAGAHSAVAAQALVAKYGGELDAQQVQHLLEELPVLVSDTDLLLAAMALGTCTTLVLQQPSCAGAVTAAVLPGALRLVQSQLLQVRRVVCKALHSLACTCRAPSYAACKPARLWHEAFTLCNQPYFAAEEKSLPSGWSAGDAAVSHGRLNACRAQQWTP